MILKNDRFLVFESLCDQSSLLFREDDTVELSEQRNVLIERTRVLSGKRQLHAEHGRVKGESFSGLARQR